MLQIPEYFTESTLLYPMQRVAEGVFFDPSVRQSVGQSISQSVSQSLSPVFLVSATPLKALNRIP